MIQYIDVRFVVEAPAQEAAIDIVTKEVNEIFNKHYANKLGPVLTTPYIISAISADSIDEFEEDIEAINLFDLYKTVRNEVKL